MEGGRELGQQSSTVLLQGPFITKLSADSIQLECVVLPKMLPNSKPRFRVVPPISNLEKSLLKWDRPHS